MTLDGFMEGRNPGIGLYRAVVDEDFDRYATAMVVMPKELIVTE